MQLPRTKVGWVVAGIWLLSWFALLWLDMVRHHRLETQDAELLLQQEKLVKQIQTLQTKLGFPPAAANPENSPNQARNLNTPSSTHSNISIECPANRTQAVRFADSPGLFICLQHHPRVTEASLPCSVLKGLNSSSPAHFIGFGRTLAPCAFYVAARGGDVSIFEPFDDSASLLVENLDRNAALKLSVKLFRSAVGINKGTGQLMRDSKENTAIVFPPKTPLNRQLKKDHKAPVVRLDDIVMASRAIVLDCAGCEYGALLVPRCGTPHRGTPRGRGRRAL